MSDAFAWQTPRQSLASCRESLRLARDEVGQQRRAAGTADKLRAAHQALLKAMESYAAELTARGLPTPPRLRDEIRLQRSMRRDRA